MAFLGFKGGGGVWVLGSKREVEDALADTASHVDGCVLFRFRHRPPWVTEGELLSVDPAAVGHVVDDLREEAA